MRAIFKNPITKSYELGIIFRTFYTNKNKKYDIISEKGTVFLALGGDTDRPGHVVKSYSNIAKKIKTNLSIETQANYKHLDFIPNILKFDI